MESSSLADDSYILLTRFRGKTSATEAMTMSSGETLC